MNFEQFASQHGLVIQRLYPADGIKRCPTEAHPGKKNGAYWYSGDAGWVWNWELGQETVIWWKSGREQDPAGLRKIREMRERMAREIAQKHRNAARRAAEIIANCERAEHNYIKSKSNGKAKRLEATKVLVTADYELIVPMRHAATNEILGCQRIFLEDNAWTKKFLYGASASMAVHRIGSGKFRIGCEGFVTGLSIKAACENGNLDAQVVVCFSADNMQRVAKAGLIDAIFADHDKLTEKQIEKGETVSTGIKVAEASGVPWTCSPVPGEDANDMLQRAGVFALQSAILTLKARCAELRIV